MPEERIVKRSEKLAFMDVGTEGTASFKRMKGFTSLPTSKSPKEYTRQYVDEAFERVDVTGIASQVDFAFDQMAGNDVHAKLVDIIDNEKILDEAQVTILRIDMSGGTSPYPAFTRTYSVIPGTEGDSFDAYTYAGSFKVNGERTVGTATLAADGQTATFTPATVPAG